LKDAPYAFGSKYEREVHAGEDNWRERLAGRAQFVAELDGQVAGTAGGVASDDPNAALISMWVARPLGGKDWARSWCTPFWTGPATRATPRSGFGWPTGTTARSSSTCGADSPGRAPRNRCFLGSRAWSSRWLGLFSHLR
jgi:hypothetical protein